MNVTYQIKRSGTNYPLIFTVLRVVLGICLAVKGIYFLNNIQLLNQAIENSTLNVLNITSIIAMFVTWVNLLGGTFIILGLFTRIAVWPQVPVLLCAILFINTRSGAFSKPSDLLFSVIILVLSILFIVEGGGKFSMDSYVKRAEL